MRKGTAHANKSMRNYELTYLISPGLSEENFKNLSNKVKNFIQEETGVLEKVTELSRRKNWGIIGTLNFSLNPEKLENLEKKLKSEKEILRYILLVKKPEKVLKKRFPSKKEKLFKTPLKITKPSGMESILRGKQKKVELEEIDKKIEEILKE